MAREVRSRAALLIAGLGLVLGVPVAYSQAGGEIPKDEDAAKLSGAEQLSRAQTRYAGMERSLKQMEGLQDRARKDKDLLRLSCVNEKIIETRGLFPIVKAGLTSLEQAVKD